MRNPGKLRDISTGVAALGAFTLVTTVIQHRGDSPNGGWFGIVIASFFVTLLSAVAWWAFQVEKARQDKLLRGDNRLAQWNVSGNEWEQFLSAEAVRREAKRGNTVRARKLDASSGIDVVISKDSLMVGDDFYHLADQEGLQWLPEKPACMEFNMATRGKNGTVRWNIRFPVAANAETQARKVWDYVHVARPSIVLVRRYRFRVRARRVASLCVIPSLLPVLFGLANLGRESMQSTAILCLVCGTGAFVVSAAVAAITHWQIKTEPLPPGLSQADQ